MDFHCPDLQPVHSVLADQEVLVQACMRDHREEKSISRLSDPGCEKAKEEADAMKADYEAEMAKAKETANSILQNAQKDAAARSEAMIQEAQTQAAGIKAKAEADIAQEKKKAVNDIKMRSVALPWILLAR